MKLLVNLGNSDIHIRFFNSSLGDPIYRNKASFSSLLLELVEVIRKSDVKFSTDGHVMGTLMFHDEKVERVFMPILSQEIKAIQETTRKSVDSVICICTRQDDSNGAESQLDTFGFKSLLNGPFGHGCLPGIGFDFLTIGCDPSDYGDVFKEYEQILGGLDLSDASVAIAQGTPAMCYALSSLAARNNPGIPQYYASHGDLSNLSYTRIIPLNLFSREEIIKQIDSFCSLMKGGLYTAAREFVKTSCLRGRVAGIEELTEYFISRSGYSFSDAWSHLMILREKNKPLYDSLGDSVIDLDKFSSCTKKVDNACGNKKDDSYLDYLNTAFPTLLFETLQNVRFNYEIGNYLLAVALMTSFLDVMYMCIIARELNLEDLVFSQVHGYPSLNSFISTTVIPSLDSSNGKDFDDIVKNWKKQTGKEDNLMVFNVNGASETALVKWFVGQGCARKETKILASFQKRQKRFLDFRRLRNNMPIAHSMGAAEKSIIDGKLFGLTFKEFIDGFIEVLKAMSEERNFDCFYHETVSSIREVIIENLCP